MEDELTDLSFTHLVDIEQIRELLEAHNNMTGVGAAILDTDENTLVAVGYHDICTRFHLIHPPAKLNCRESDAYVKAHLSECKDGYLDYRCKNGLVNVAVPIIIRGEHLATFFTGQFFYDDDKPDVESFRKQSEKFGFDETGYLEALGRVPIFTRDHVHKITEYNRNLVRIIAEMGLKNLELLNEVAKRNQYEEELLLCRFCIEKAGIGIYCLEENGAISCVNDYACTSLGYSKNELCKLSIFDIDPVITREKMLEINTIMDSLGSATHETIHRRRDGTTFPVEITSNLLEFHGKTLGILFVKEITERKRAEEALRKSRQMLMSVLDNFPGVVFWKDRNSFYMGCNNNFSLAAGLSEPSEIVGKNDHELPWKNDAERYLADDRKVVESGAPKLNIIETLLHADGRVAWFETSKVPLFDEDGEVFAVLGSSNDITERKKAEEALKEGESQVRRKLESILDPEGDIGELDLADIIDASEIQALMDDLYRNTGLKMSIIDLNGRVLVDVGWQEICRKFHRGHPETRERCRESDTVMTEGVPPGEFKTYRCRNNMWHLVTPIFVGGRHMGNLFMGQFFFENEELDYELFRAQASEYGFPEEEYIAALEAVPRHSEECVNRGKAFFLRLIDMFSKLSYGNIKLARLLAERDRLTETLRQANKVVENSPVVLFRWEGGDEWPVEMVSGNVMQFGYTPDEFLTRSITYSSIMHPDDLGRVTREVHDFCDGGVDQFRLEYRIITKGGDVRWVNELTHVEPHPAGHVKYFEGVVIDVTERKRMEEELRCSEEKYRSIVDAYDGLIYICSQDYRIEFMNRKLIERTGYSAVGELCYRVLHDRDSICPWCVNGQVCAGETVHWEILSPKDGRWYYVVNVPIYNANGTVSKHSVIADITERKGAEESIKRAKEEWERTFASLPDLIAILDNRHRVLRVNEAMAKRLGLKPDDYIGHPCYEAIHGLSDPHPFCPHTQTLKDGRKHVVEIHEERLGGDFLVSTTPLNDEWGVMIGSVHNAYDITERKQIERMLSVKREQVAAMVVELSMAEERERLRIASVLHDHVGQTMLLSRIKLGTLAGIAKPESVERVIEDVETLLDKAIDETHSLTIQLNPPILAVSGLEVALQWLGNRMESDYGLVVEFSDDMRAKPLSDELRSVLYQCTRELLINVVKHANTDRAWLRVRLEDGMFRLTVEDRGAGFNPDDIVPDLSRDSRFGIFSIQIRIERMGGRMDIESSPGSGTRITILLPIKTTPP
jgi:PAS domain S-box-containing protein